MAHHQQQQPQSWDRWQHHNTAPDYEMMDHMTPYDPRTVPSTTSLQLPTISAQYTLPTTYADSPVTPMSASSYGSPSHFGNYGHSYYQTPSAPTSFAPLPLRSAHRPTAPPTPPLEDDRGMRLHDGRMGGSLKSTLQRSPSRRGVSQVKSESGKEPKEIKTCPVFVKEDRTLQYESHKPFDVLLKKVNSKKQLSSGASTPVSMASPASEEDSGQKKPFKKFRCTVCNAAFGQAAQLVTHMRSHTGEKPFKCDECGKCISQIGNMKAHKRRHTGEKPWSCPSCPQQFASNGGLKVHIRRKHDGEPKHECPIEKCDKDFSTIGNMKVHITKFHEPIVNHYLRMVDEAEEFVQLPEKDRQLLDTLSHIYKNSNKGIPGRGPGTKEEKSEKQSGSTRRHAAHQEMTPVSPDASNNVHQYRTYYDQQHQQHYHVLPHPSQQPMQQHPGYLQLPMHQQPHPVYHGLPTPATSYNMGWTPGPQY